MKLPSIDLLVSEAAKTIIRFPLTWLFALIGTTSAIMAIENMGDEMIRLKVGMCAAIGLTSSLALALATSYYRIKKSLSSLYAIVLLALIVVYYFTLGDTITDMEGVRYFTLNISLHLVVSFVLFIRNKQVNDFWNFNKTLFIRIILSGVYSATLIVGLNFAVLAINSLFNVEVDGKLYGEIPVVVIGLFNTLFFLAGIPKNEELHHELQYPKGLKTFTQFVLVPLVTLYLLILLTYEGRIILLASLPKGWVSILILVFSVLGILAMLLVYPLRNLEENKWIKQLWRWYFWLLIPLLGLLYWAILYRVNLYGFTVERYYVLLLAIWLTGITIYSIFKPNYHIRVIPISLTLVGLFSLYGPQSASTVSKISQKNRLSALLTQHQIKPLDFESRKEISSVVHYLYTNFDKKELVAYFPKAFKTDSSYTTVSVSDLLTSVNIEYVGRYENEETKTMYLTGSTNDEVIPVPAADCYWHVRVYNNSYSKNIATKWGEISMDINDSIGKLSIGSETLLLDLSQVFSKLVDDKDSYTVEEFTVTGSSKTYEVTMLISSIQLNKQKETNTYALNGLEADLFLYIKK